MDKKDFGYLPPKYVDGVEELHKRLNDAYKKAIRISNLLIGTPLPEAHDMFDIFIDPNNTLPSNKLKGYFMFNKIIHRFLSVTFDMALLLPVRNHGGGSIRMLKNIVCKDVCERVKDGCVLHCGVEINENKRPLHRIIPIYPESHFFMNKDKVDDIGMPVNRFPDIEELKIADVPELFLKKNFSLVGEQFYAPYATSHDTYCVLFAELENEYDANAIKVLRWLPVNKECKVDQLMGLEPNGGDLFFEWGYISRTENSELHDFMVDKKSRLLFGKVADKKISIMGRVKTFKTSSLKYPKCLYNIKLS